MPTRGFDAVCQKRTSSLMYKARKHLLFANNLPSGQVGSWSGAIFQLIGRSVPKSDRGTLTRSRYSSLAPSNGVTWGSTSQAPRQVLGVVTLHAICEE